MVTITEAIKYYIETQAEEISGLKTAAIKLQTIERYAYVSPDGNSVKDERPTAQEMASGWVMAKVKRDKVIGHISPTHPDWPRYQAARRRASLLLTCRLLLKLGEESVPGIGEVRRALQDGGLAHHAKRGCGRSLCFAAYRYLRKLANRLERAPERFAVVECGTEGRQRSSIDPTTKEEARV